MHDQIRIAADRRREVRVTRGREPEVAEVLRRITRLLHRPQHEERNRLLFRLPLDLLNQFLKMFRTKRRERRAEAVPETRDEVLELAEFHHVGFLVDAIE